ncbi:MAG TPA: class II aldolase/adducin family protein [Candidatus Paceibacterota bacterium]|nr:class II aldolase/adducin family protein [Candidatus Paceibacterota bacterium]
MKQVISVRDLEEMVRSGKDIRSLPENAILTPSARDFIRDFDGKVKPGSAASVPSVKVSAIDTDTKPQPSSKPLTSKSPKAELEAFFNSPYALSLKQQICDMGKRLWAREYVDGNGGNMAIRVGEDIAICTPTLVSKGSLKPEDMCLVDFEGNQLLGTKKRTSEILMHLQMMKRQPKAVATCHCHPPYATAFAIVGEAPPTCMLPEYEVFCSVGVAPYRTPGSPEMGKLVAELTDQYNTILMANHGVVTWSHNNIEEAYWRMEIIEAYCRTIIVAGQLGKPINTFTGPQMKEILNIKKSLGYVDPRYNMKECELCDTGEWRPGVTCSVEPKENSTIGYDADAEAAVKAITDQIMSQMKQG